VAHASAPLDSGFISRSDPVIRIFDTTLRDGEQSPGATMTSAARLQIALALEAAHTDVIEAGFPAASPHIANSVAEISSHVRDSVIAAFSRTTVRDIDISWDSIRKAAQPRLFTCIAPSDDHIRVKLKSTRDDVLRMIESSVRHCVAHTSDVQFAAEDGSRSDRDFLLRAFTVAAAAGARIVTLPDTVGYMQPEEFGDLVRFIKERLPDGVELSVHCHDDLGLAVANTLAAIRNGADEVQVTVNGIGERAGNCSLEEVVVALCVRSDYYGTSTNFVSERIPELSKMVAAATNMPVAKNKAIVGAHAFLHESGIHQDGVLKQRSLYEAIPAELIGRTPGQLHLGRNSGRNGLRARLETLGATLTKEQLDRAYQMFLGIANTSRDIDDAQLLQLIARVSDPAREVA
jgi:2-isopropylmalate synthase